MKPRILAVSVMMLAANAGFAQVTNYPKAKVSFDDFKGLVAEVEAHRASRLIDLNTFIKMSKEPGVIILDSRSTFRFDRIHVKGARHLAFTDFTQDNLQKVIPSFETTILIYCNNNFDGNQTDFASKVALPRPKPGNAAATQFAAQAKPIMMALNIPTYINLYGYGYRNVYELHELVNVNDPRIAFEGSIVEQKPAPLAPPPAQVTCERSGIRHSVARLFDNPLTRGYIASLGACACPDRFPARFMLEGSLSHPPVVLRCRSRAKHAAVEDDVHVHYT